MSTDTLLERLREMKVTWHQISDDTDPYEAVRRVHPVEPLRAEAADEIERLRAALAAAEARIAEERNARRSYGGEEMNIDNIKEGARLVREGMRKFESGPLDYYLDCLVAAYNLVIDRFSPFKVGQRVILSKTPRIDEDHAPGWRSAKHWLRQGTAGVVKSAEVTRDGAICFSVEFDDESWIDRDGIVRPIEDKHVYSFGEDWLAAEPEPTRSQRLREAGFARRKTGKTAGGLMRDPEDDTGEPKE